MKGDLLMTKRLSVLVAAVLVLCMLCSSAFACTAIYVGSALTDGDYTFFARSEDYANSRNKVFYVSPAGNHKAGELYEGCYGFTYTFTHDSYSYTAMRDDNLEAVAYVCPNCGDTHAHTPYEAAGTNEMGVSVSATETLGCSDVAYEADPYEDLGIEEAEIVTVLLSEAATAREGVELILSIYDHAGCNAGAGIFVADHNEVWYIENVTGHQYVALKMSDVAVFSEPNVSVIGLVDLDDENVIGSPNLIQVAVDGGFFVGDAEANVINFKASYNAGEAAGTRLKNALNFFNPALYDFSETEPDPELYCLTNVDAEGNIVPLHTNIELDRAFGIADVVDYYHVPAIGKTGNLETHIFQISPEDSLTDTVEWVALDDASINVFVPYYPMLTLDTYAACQLGTVTAAFVEEEPAQGLYYATTKTKRVDGQRVTVEGYCVLPANWADSYYWSVDAVSNILTNTPVTDEQKAATLAALAEQQAALYAGMADMAAAVAADPDNAATIATAASMEMQAASHQLLVNLANDLLAK